MEIFYSDHLYAAHANSWEGTGEQPVVWQTRPRQVTPPSPLFTFVPGATTQTLRQVVGHMALTAATSQLPIMYLQFTCRSLPL